MTGAPRRRAESVAASARRRRGTASISTRPAMGPRHQADLGAAISALEALRQVGRPGSCTVHHSRLWRRPVTTSDFESHGYSPAAARQEPHRPDRTSMIRFLASGHLGGNGGSGSSLGGFKNRTGDTGCCCASSSCL
jgi:hypothetical protein